MRKVLANNRSEIMQTSKLHYIISVAVMYNFLKGILAATIDNELIGTPVVSFPLHANFHLSKHIYEVIIAKLIIN